MTAKNLNETIDEMVAHVATVADLTDKAFPGQNKGPEIRACAKVLKEHLSRIEAAPPAAPADQSALFALATKNCESTFKHLEDFKPSDFDEKDVKLYGLLTVHAREMFELIQSSGCGGDACGCH